MQVALNNENSRFNGVIQMAGRSGRFRDRDPVLYNFQILGAEHQLE